ncbi:30S ribosomal protein S20 [Candidatus Wolfebacteria bacterium]|nr:30S ribosomal protein S20 [Candidatus Wolfebacteria bacterium]
MPITQSAKKALRQNIRRRMRNLKRKTELKSAIKQYKKMVVAGDKEGAKKFLSQVYKKLDKAAKVNSIKKNRASRLKSRLSKLLVVSRGAAL